MPPDPRFAGVVGGSSSTAPAARRPRSYRDLLRAADQARQAGDKAAETRLRQAAELARRAEQGTAVPTTRQPTDIDEAKAPNVPNTIRSLPEKQRAERLRDERRADEENLRRLADRPEDLRAPRARPVAGRADPIVVDRPPQLRDMARQPVPGDQLSDIRRTPPPAPTIGPQPPQKGSVDPARMAGIARDARRKAGWKQASDPVEARRLYDLADRLERDALIQRSRQAIGGSPFLTEAIPSFMSGGLLDPIARETAIRSEILGRREQVTPEEIERSGVLEDYREDQTVPRTLGEEGDEGRRLLGSLAGIVASPVTRGALAAERAAARPIGRAATRAGGLPARAASALQAPKTGTARVAREALEFQLPGAAIEASRAAQRGEDPTDAALYGAAGGAVLGGAYGAVASKLPGVTAPLIERGTESFQRTARTAREALERRRQLRARKEAVRAEEASPTRPIANLVEHERRVAEEKASPRRPNREIQLAAETYVQERKLGTPKPKRLKELDPVFHEAAARHYADAKSTPDDPAVRQAYEAMAREVDEQYAVMERLGIKVEPVLEDPYPNSAAMMEDVRVNRRLRVFAGSAEHPVLTPEQNIKFRAVHDFFGHAQEGNQFGPVGEENAFREHSRMFSPTARRAMATETRGQNSWVNFGPNKDLPVKERPYAEQKAFLMPEGFDQPYEIEGVLPDVPPLSQRRLEERGPTAAPRAQPLDRASVLDRVRGQRTGAIGEPKVEKHVSGWRAGLETYLYPTDGGDVEVLLSRPRAGEVRIENIVMPQAGWTGAKGKVGAADMRALMNDLIARTKAHVLSAERVSGARPGREMRVEVGDPLIGVELKPKRAGAVGEPEKIVAAASKSVDGRVFTGQIHYFAQIEGQAQGAGGPFTDGFVTSKGRFLTRAEAMKLAEKVHPTAANRNTLGTSERPLLSSESFKPGELDPTQREVKELPDNVDPETVHWRTNMFMALKADHPDWDAKRIVAEIRKKEPAYLKNRDGAIGDLRGGENVPRELTPDRIRGTATQLQRMLKTRGGFTFNPRTGKFMEEGFAVGAGKIKGQPIEIPEGEVTLDKLGDFLEANAELFAKEQNAMVGGWLDRETGKIVLEPSIVYGNRNQAIRRGRKLGEKAIGDLGKYAKGEDGDVKVDARPEYQVDVPLNLLDQVNKDAPERLIAPAVASPDGKRVKAGEIHATARQNLLRQANREGERFEFDDLEEGYITSHGRFLDREEAGELARLKRPAQSEDLRSRLGAIGTKVRAAAVMIDGKVYEGPTHADARDEALEKLGLKEGEVEYDQGFVDETGSYISREEAMARLTGRAPDQWRARSEMFDFGKRRGAVGALKERRIKRAVGEVEEILARRRESVEGRPFPAMLRRAITIGVRETLDALEKMPHAREWYKADLGRMEEAIRGMLPETADPAQMKLFKLIVAITSSGLKPTANLEQAVGVYENYLRTGRLTIFEPDVRIVKNAQGATLYRGKFAPGVKGSLRQNTTENSLRQIQDYLDQNADDLEGALTRLYTDRLPSKWRRKETGEVIEGEEPRIVSEFGDWPKIGRFYANLNGMPEEVTVDIWATRTLRSWLGYAKTGGESASQPSELEQQLMRKAVTKIAASLSESTGKHYDPMDVQALLWYYEKARYLEMGAVDSEQISYAGAAERLAEKRSQGSLFDTPVGGRAARGDAEGRPARAGKRGGAPGPRARRGAIGPGERISVPQRDLDAAAAERATFPVDEYKLATHAEVKGYPVERSAKVLREAGYSVTDEMIEKARLLLRKGAVGAGLSPEQRAERGREIVLGLHKFQSSNLPTADWVAEAYDFDDELRKANDFRWDLVSLFPRKGDLIAALEKLGTLWSTEREDRWLGQKKEFLGTRGVTAQERYNLDTSLHESDRLRQIIDNAYAVVEADRRGGHVGSGSQGKTIAGQLGILVAPGVGAAAGAALGPEEWSPEERAAMGAALGLGVGVVGARALRDRFAQLRPRRGGAIGGSPTPREGTGTPYTPTPDQAVNFEKFAQDLDPDARAELEAAVDSLIVSGQATKKRVTWEETDRIAQELGIDPEQIVARERRLTGAEMLALRNLVSENVDRIAKASRELADPRLSDDSKRELQEQIGRLMGRNEVYLSRFVKERSQAGRDLNNLKIIAKKDLNPAVWVAQAQRMKVVSLTQGEIDKIHTLAREKKREELVAYVAGFRKTGPLDKLLTLWKAGLLTSPTTHAANIGGNLSMAALETAKEPLAGVIDYTIALLRGNAEKYRTKDVTFQGLTLAQAGGLTKGARAALQVMKTGVSPKDLEKWDVRKAKFDSPLLQAYVDTVFNTLSAEDQLFRGAALGRAIYENARLRLRGLGLKPGSPEFQAQLDALTARPDDELMTQSLYDAELATFQNDNPVAKWLTSYPKYTERAPFSRAALALTLPFVRTPANVAARLVDYTPAGLLTTLARQVTDPSQKKLAEGLARSALGSSLVWYGVQLYKEGKATGAMPSEANERATWEEEGRLPNAVNIDGHWLQIGRLTPGGMLVSLGAQLAAIAEQSDTGLQTAAGAVGSVGRLMADQSFLRGVSSAAEAISNPAERGKSFVNTLAGSVVPAAVGRIAAGIDPSKRQVDNPIDAIQARIPGARQAFVPAKKSAFGEDMPEPRGVLSFLFDPFSTTPENKDPLLQEMRRVGLDVRLPSRTVPDSTRKKGERRRTNEERRTWLADAGPELKKGLDDLIARQEYKALPDEMKKDLFGRVSARLAREANEREQGKATDRTEPTVVVQDAIESLATEWLSGENRREAQALLDSLVKDPTAAQRAPREVQKRAVGLIKQKESARLVSEILGALDRGDDEVAMRAAAEAEKLGIDVGAALKARLRRRLAVKQMLDAQAQLTP